MMESDVEMTTIKCVLCGLQLQIEKREKYHISESIVRRSWKIIEDGENRIRGLCPFCKAKQGGKNETY